MRYPNGGRCLTCVNLLSDCSSVPFEDMPPCGKVDKEGDQEVVCLAFIKTEEKWRDRLDAKMAEG